MQIKEMNDIQRNMMRPETNLDIEYQWEDPYLEDKLLGLLKELEVYYEYTEYAKKYDIDEATLRTKIKEFNDVIDLFNSRKIGHYKFLEIIKEKIKVIENLLPFVHIPSYEWYEGFISEYKSIFIKGPGGIGKSYYLYKLEQKIEANEIRHICLYGKFSKRLNSLNWTEILNSSKQKEFVFIFDAINEISKEERDLLLNKLEELLNIEGFRAIISCRDSMIAYEEEEKYKTLLLNKYDFQGIQFEDAIIKLIESFGVHATKFDNIININNPLYLNSLRKALSKPGISIENLNGYSQITLILETIIKDKISSEAWEMTKVIDEYLYLSNKTNITKDEIVSVLGNGKNANLYIQDMKTKGLINEYSLDGKIYFTFYLETLNQFMMAREFIKEIDGKSADQIIELIKYKRESGLGNCIEAFFISLFDKFHQDIETVLVIFKGTNRYDVNFKEVLAKAKFTNQDAINKIQEHLILGNPLSDFPIFGGLVMKPFNCMNYFNNFFKNTENLWAFANNKTYQESQIKSKLHNILYYSILIDEDSHFIEEFFWFAFWCMSSINSNNNKLAKKIVFHITNKFSRFVSILSEIYFDVEDEYIKNGIVGVLASLTQEHRDLIENLFSILIKDKKETNAYRLHKISQYLYGENVYIKWKKKNRLRFLGNKKAMDEVYSLLFVSNLYDKPLLPFDSYSDKDEIKLLHPFIKNKNKIIRWNKKISKKYKCILSGDCEGDGLVERSIVKRNRINIKLLNPKKLFIGFQKEFLTQLKFFNYDINRNEIFDRINPFSDSLLKKIIIITRDNFFGSLMCNYYTKEFRTWERIGYEPYNQYEYGEGITITSPISIYNEKIDLMMEKILRRIQIPEVKNINWANDYELSKSNLFNLIAPFSFEREEWILIGGNIDIREKSKNELIWDDCYMFSISIDSDRKITIYKDEDREHAIDRPSYTGNINEYVNMETDICYTMDETEGHSEVFKSTAFLLPPSKIIKEFNLEYEYKNSTWKEQQNNEVIIFTNNNACDYYNENFSYALFMRKKEFDILYAKHDVRFFGYTERFIKKTGYSNESSRIVEFDSTKILKDFEWYNNDLMKNFSTENKCESCQHGFKKEMERSPEDLKKMGRFMEERIGKLIGNSEENRLFEELLKQEDNRDEDIDIID